MTIESMQTISLVSFVLAGIFLLLAIALFFYLEVPKLVGDITGATARKAIEEIRQQNEESGGKGYRPSQINLSRGMLTDKISASGRLERRKSNIPGIGTSKLSTTELLEAAALPASDETTLLEYMNVGAETTLLYDEVLVDAQETSAETTLLDAELLSDTGYNYDSSETTLLDEYVIDEPIDEFSIEVDMNYASSTEIIE